MITLVPPHLGTPHDVRDVAGAFGWHYVDVVNADGDGVVLIFGEALPFLPPAKSASATSTQTRQAQTPRQAPSINLAVYRRGRQVFYALQELAPADVSVDVRPTAAAANPGAVDDSVTRLCFGKTTCSIARSAGRVVVDVDVDVCVDGVCAARGRVVVEGAARVDDTVVRGDPRATHRWSPQTGPATGHARLVVDGVDVDVVGRGYHDENASAVPLVGLGIRHWAWGRVATTDAAGRPEERLVYVVDGNDGGRVAFGLVVDEDGRTRHLTGLTLRAPAAHRSVWGRDVYDRVVVEDDAGAVFIDVSLRVVESGPFYVRSLGADVAAVFEQVVPRAIDSRALAPLFSMRVARRAGRRSPFLPLFFGHPASRFARFARHLLGRGAGAPLLLAERAVVDPTARPAP